MLGGLFQSVTMSKGKKKDEAIENELNLRRMRFQYVKEPTL